MERRTIFPDLATVSLLICFRIVGVMTEASNHRYKPEEKVPPYANKVEPFHNPRKAQVSGETIPESQTKLKTKKNFLQRKRMWKWSDVHILAMSCYSASF